MERRYLIMEYVDGAPLSELVGRHVFADWRAFTDVALQLASGLAALHAAGSVHRDIKPPNIMVETASGRAVIMDFGVVSDLDATTLLTEGHEFLGTVRYASPEWLYRHPPAPAQDPQIDVYSLGATFFEMMVGAPPFNGIRNRHQLGEAVRRAIPTVAAPPNFHRAAAALVREMLAKAPDARPTLTQVIESIQRLAAAAEGTAPIDEQRDNGPMERFRGLMADREDIRRSADKEQAIEKGWREFEDVWKLLEAAWDLENDPMKTLPGIVDFDWTWCADDRITWDNSDRLKRSFPDRQWT